MKKASRRGCQILLCSSLTDAKGGIGDREVAYGLARRFVKFGARILIDCTGNACCPGY